ncbi:hypothetical protein DEO72_LG2g2059 [Vigna unguiculata]|uniref:Uncharacterized protein n=1 Tax=Vigna unguiculata TaxID=3917 RepID=A0A4D6KZU3_VIGUN|nr:hypothetical protein DEO72_LG2g2059 [Vigna unguiculata]
MSTTLSATTSPRRSGDEGCRGAKRAIASKEGNSRATKKKNDASRVNDGSGRKLQRHWRRFGLVDVEVRMKRIPMCKAMSSSSVILHTSLVTPLAGEGAIWVTNLMIPDVGKA